MSRLSSLPRSLSQLRIAIQRSGSGAAFSYIRHPSRAMQQQGTRATIPMGTMSSGNTPNPLVPGQTVTPNMPMAWDDPIDPETIQFSTEKLVVDGTQGTIIQTRDWPPNPSESSISPDAGHSEQLRTDAAMQMGEGPGRIWRGMPWRVFGVAEAATGHNGSEESLGGMADTDYLAHIPIARRALGVKGPQKLSDDNLPIPAIYAGNPRA